MVSRLRLPFYILVWLGSCLSFAGTAEFSQSTVIPWNKARIDLEAKQTDVGRILEEFGRQQQIPVRVGERVEGTVSGVMRDVAAQSLLDALCDAHGLSWFFDGSQIFVDRNLDRLTRHRIAAKITEEDFENTAIALGLATGPESEGGIVKNGTRTGFLTISGIPSFVNAAESLIDEMDDHHEERLVQEVVSRQFRLVYASASDTTVSTGSGTTQIAGVARILQDMLGLEGGGGLSTGDVRYTRPALVSRRESGETAATALSMGPGQGDAGAGPAGNQSPPPAAEGEAGGIKPSITANSRLNAIVVRDVVGRMPLYEELIGELDVPTQVIQIRASIVDVSATDRREFSNEFLGSLTTSTGDVRRFGFDADRGIFDGNGTQGQIPSFADGSDLVRGVGGRFSTILGGSNWELLTRVKALEEKGIAQLVTSPQLLTEENRAATIRFEETVYVRLVGERDVDLTPITTGTELRVTPTVIREVGETKFMLEIEITDGNFTDDSVDQIPTTQESIITTKAMIPENRTLLLGGNTIMRQFKNDRQVPLIGDIPLVGRLFGAREKVQSRVQRFFFLTPELIDVTHDSRPVELEDPAEIPGGDMTLTRQLPPPYVSPTRVADHARRLNSAITGARSDVVPKPGPAPRKIGGFIPLPPPPFGLPDESLKLQPAEPQPGAGAKSE